MASRGFEDLDVWQHCRPLVVLVYRITSLFPPTEQFGITSQMRRACVSISSNIAEGSARNSSKDFARFIAMALGSAAELKSQTIHAIDLGFIQPEAGNSLIEDIQKIGRMLKGLQRNIKPLTINH